VTDHHRPPIARLAPDDGEPMWKQILSLFEKHGQPPPPVQLRDELVTHLQWARFGETSHKRAS
jgi:hypothetical protein